MENPSYNKIKHIIKDNTLWRLKHNEDIKLGRKEYCNDVINFNFSICAVKDELEDNYCDYKEYFYDTIDSSIIGLYYCCKRLSLDNNSYIYIDDIILNCHSEDDIYNIYTGYISVYYTKNDEFKNRRNRFLNKLMNKGE